MCPPAMLVVPFDAFTKVPDCILSVATEVPSGKWMCMQVCRLAQRGNKSCGGWAPGCIMYNYALRHEQR